MGDVLWPPILATVGVFGAAMGLLGWWLSGDEEPQITFRRIHPGARPPCKAHANDAGWDLAACEGAVLRPWTRAVVRTGLVFGIPAGWEVQIRPRSGLAMKHGVTVTNSPGTVDAGFQGEMLVMLVNHGTDTLVINPGDRVAQAVPARVADVAFQEVAEAEAASARGERGFGSSG